jgi:hypothetical protein
LVNYVIFKQPDERGCWIRDVAKEKPTAAPRHVIQFNAFPISGWIKIEDFPHNAILFSATGVVALFVHPENTKSLFSMQGESREGHL